MRAAVSKRLSLSLSWDRIAIWLVDQLVASLVIFNVDVVDWNVDLVHGVLFSVHKPAICRVVRVKFAPFPIDGLLEHAIGQFHGHFRLTQERVALEHTWSEIILRAEVSDVCREISRVVSTQVDLIGSPVRPEETIQIDGLRFSYESYNGSLVCRLAEQVGRHDAANGFLDASHPVAVLPPVVVVLALPALVGLVEVSVLTPGQLRSDRIFGITVRLAVPVFLAVPATLVAAVGVGTCVGGRRGRRINSLVSVRNPTGRVISDCLDASCSCRGELVHGDHTVGCALAVCNHRDLLALALQLSRRQYLINHGWHVDQTRFIRAEVPVLSCTTCNCRVGLIRVEGSVAAGVECATCKCDPNVVLVVEEGLGKEVAC